MQNDVNAEKIIEPAKLTKEKLTVTASVLYQTVIAVSLICSVLTVAVNDYFFEAHSGPVQIATFDMPGYLKQLQSDLISGKITEQQMLAKLDDVTKRLDSQPSNVVVISGDCILGHPKQVRKIDAP
jgi:predicted MPP superfamily phosphohydrolase